VGSGRGGLAVATSRRPPFLLLCAAGAWLLANAILRDTDGEMSGNRVLRWAAFALALVILPLTVFAAVSLGTRIGQHGLSPERIWGLIAVAVATAFGLAYGVAGIRGRRAAWRDRLRGATRSLAAGGGVPALWPVLPLG